jgi:phenylacetate-CoA ligase
LVVWAYDRVPFWRGCLEAHGLRPGDIRSVADLEKIPITTKERLRAAPLDQITARSIDLGACVEVTTSGSTGLPLRVIFSRRDFTRLNMGWLRPLLAWGIRPWHAMLEITGPHNIHASRAWYQKLGIWRKRQVSVFRPVEEWVDLWNRLRPEVLYGYSGSLSLMAQWVLARGRRIHRPKFVVGVSDLCLDSDRGQIRRAFGCELIDLYGAAETGCLAWQCRDCGNYHINGDALIVQICREGRPVSAGQSGQVIVTNLLSRAMPIIRYDLGDIGRLSARAPACGRSLPLMEVIEGRADSILRMPSGRQLSPMFFYGVMKPVPGLAAWRIIQEEEGTLKILFVPASGAPPDLKSLIHGRVEQALAEEIQVGVFQAEDLPPDPSGKVRAVISRMPSNGTDGIG